MQNSDMMAKAGVISANSLEYNLKPDLSVTTSRTDTLQFFQSNTYSSGSTMVNILNSGSAYINGRTSVLILDVASTAGSPAFGFGPTGSAANLINRITIMSRSGVVLERIDSSNVLSSIKMFYEHDKSWMDTVGRLAGGGDVNNATPVAAFANPLVSTRFIIPLCLISGLFNYENLLPASLMSGLRIELVLASPITSLQAAAAADYQITGCSIKLDSYQITDSITRTLNEAAASSGLEVVFKTYFTTVGTRTSDNLNFESRRSCSRALAVTYKEQVTRALYTVDPMATTAIAAGYGPTAVQFRAGSLYFPNSVISGSAPPLASPEIQAMAFTAFNKYNTEPVSSNVVGSGVYGYATNSVIATTLERSTALELSGIPLSNSRTLALNASFVNPVAANMNSYLFLEYASLARVFISNTTVEV